MQLRMRLRTPLSRHSPLPITVPPSHCSVGLSIGLGPLKCGTSRVRALAVIFYQNH